MPTDLAQIFDLIRQHGDVVYALMFGYAAGNTLLIVLFAGYVAHTGALDMATLIPVCWGGAFAGDTVRFWIGRRFGIGFLKRWPRLQRGIETSARLIDRHYLWVPFVYRYPNGIRTVAGFAFGLSKLSWPLFLVLNFLSAGMWAVTVLYAGFAFGHVTGTTLSNTASHLSLVALIGFLALAWLLSSRLDRAVERN